MPLDPEFTALITRLTDAGALPLVRGTAQDTRAHYRALSLARRGQDFVPERVASVVDATVPGPDGPLPVRIYTPDPAHAVVLFLHGGGWVMGDLDTHDPVCRRVANAVGATVVALDYRLAPEHPHPAPVDDAWAALREVAACFPGRPLAVAGDSAGASLAAGLALHSRDEGGPALAAQLLVYPATDPSMAHDSVRRNGEGRFLTAADMAWFYRQYAPTPAQAGDPRVDLLTAPDLAGLPPAVVATAEFDPLHDEGAAYAERLRAAGVPVTHLDGPGLIHGYFAFLGTVPAADARSREVLAAFATLLR
ncbi:alpha/beta hydrolase [Pseudonocardia abyssalis]|uniref:Alpha/beta hydrolase n=1 Tax=Pseudonocardia abyssalis TaxID=2792008 RepID=A0ABS6UQS7_9PSEU|nr:alpha/beta hydrolase [Pseudonocardia abyssalis]MBW0114951.1 alpha/beta hydrolase [Pseudonocardia abyssalis]MBW0134620.1 alpha/beta hydrolase [Pseudonocardia abyssalis]